MGSWVALVLVVAAGAPPVLETRYFETAAACDAWAARITTPFGAAAPNRQIASCHHVRELIGRLAQGR